MNTKTKVIIVLALIIVALLSMSKISDWATNPKTHEHSIAEIDDKIKTVMELTAGATASSAAISFLPDDQCTPIAQELAELGKYFLIVLSALYLEKYLITVTGFIAFKVLIPIACVVLGIGWLAGKDALNVLAGKIALGALAIYLMVPTSVFISDLIYENYATSIEDTIETAKEVSIEDNESDAYNQLLGWITEAVGKAREYVSNMLTHFIEALAVMIVTSCIIPILVILLFLWLIKLIFGVELTIKLPHTLKRKI